MTEPDLSGVRVLVIEDASRIAMLIRDMLEEIGCEVVAMATRLDDALEKATSLSFEVALLDINLNGESVEPLAQLLAKRGVPFVFATGYGSSKVPAAFRNAPVMPKPFMRRHMESALRKALGS